GGSHGMKICASESGVVIRTNTTCTHDYGKDGSCGCGGGYGNFIIVDHGNGFVTLYGHLSEVDCTIGDRVKAGDVIGKMGSTGFSTGDHLHFEIRYNGYVMNPAYYVDIH
ncbi:MAG: M23 family metallopeptidase, partial [Ruminococcus sp.]|nr:M23 family metallopeptidase [Ruminococcus sp.]